MFAADARTAIGAAVEAGITLDELAWEIDYPGGAAAMDGPQVDQEIAEMQDRGPAFAPDPLAGARDAGPHWLEVRESQMPDGSAVETLHGTPEMVAAWAYPPVSEPVATEEGLTDDRLAAEVASLRERFTAARDDAVRGHATEDQAGGQDTGVDGASEATRADIQDLQDRGLEEGGAAQAGPGT